ncbi:MAG: TonB-dependent hemoglobin/transferrin/lactoferrin family receptor [Thermoanaerobaculia bacterium]
MKIQASWRRLGVALVAPFLFVSLVSAAPAERPADADGARSKSPEGNQPEEVSSTAEPEAGFEGTVTVTATRTSRRLLDTPGGVAVITKEQLERELASTVDDLVRYEPGVEVAEDPTRLGAGGFTIRGIGGNRVLTRIDGVPVAESFAFGPLENQQYALDPQAVSRMEIVKSAGSALYGSDALGGVVAMETRDPEDFLIETDGSPYLGFETGWDGRRSEWRESAAVAAGGDRLRASLLVARRDGSELDNQGTVDSADALRTTPNPQDREATNILGKLIWQPTSDSAVELAVERFDGRAETEVFSSRTVQNQGPTSIDTRDFDADDNEERQRLSLEYRLTRGTRLFDVLVARAWGVRSEAVQETAEERVTTLNLGAPPLAVERHLDGVYSFEQDNVGAELQLTRALETSGLSHLFTYGVTASRDRFDMLRDRIATDPATGEVVEEEGLFYPTKYFPESRVDELGAFVQDEITLASGRLRLIPGLRWDRFRLRPEPDDAVYMEGNPGSPRPAELDNSAWSPRLGAVWAFTDRTSAFVQYARGFRAPPYSAVNNGFTNVGHGYTTLPNPDLDPETSDNYELGLRRSGERVEAGVVLFDNRYDDFIETVTVGFNPATGLIEFQPQNVEEVRIQGVEVSARARLPHDLTLRTGAAWIEGENETSDQPLNSVSPPSAVVGLGWSPGLGRFGGELVGTFVAEKDESDLDRSAVEQFAAPAYEVVDLTGFVRLSDRLTLRAGVFNLFDTKYWRWPAAQGLTEGSPLLDRYTSPGRSFGASLKVRW